MGPVPIGYFAVGFSGVHAHGRHHDPVFERNSFDFVWRKQMAHLNIILLTKRAYGYL
jgi:hypothetical protein